MKNKANFKWNNGNLALLCHNCSIIIKTGIDFSKEEIMACKGMKYLEPQYCEKCLKEQK